MGFLEIFDMEYYNIGFIIEGVEGLINSKIVPNVIWMKHSYKDRFFADPFLYKIGKKNIYLFAEEYTVYDRKGRIVLLTIDKKSYNLLNRELIIDEDTHISFPYYCDGKIYPENYRSGNYYSYKLKDKFLIKEMVANLPCIDPMILEYNGIKWLFTSFKEHAMDQLNLYYYNNGWVAHPNNPISAGSKTSRMAGHIFEYNGKLYRPTQDCENGYGNKTRIMEICHISEETYKEVEVAVLDSANYYPYNMGLHTLNVEEGIIIVDGYIRKRKPLSRVFYAIKKRVMKNSLSKEFISDYSIIER